MTETTQEAPAKLWCDNPAHVEDGFPAPAVYRTTWPDGRFKPAFACGECLDEQLQLYVLDDDMDGRLHPVLVELAESAAEADEAKAEHFARDAQLLAGAKMLSHALEAAEAKLDAIADLCRRRAVEVRADYPGVEMSAVPVSAASILAIIGSEEEQS